jgi:hypothetical protein
MLIQLNRLSYGDEMYAKPPLYGLYEVDNYVIGNDTLQPLVTDKYRWRYMAIDWKERAYIQTMNGEGLYCKCNIDTVAKKITLKKDSLNYSFLYKAAGNQLQLDGNNQHKKLLIDMHRKDVTDFRLVKTGFNWVNEYPNNR